MEFLFNDLSIHEQFSNIPSFRESIRHIMEIRQRISYFGFNFYCHRNVVNRRVTNKYTMQQAIYKLQIDERRDFMQWLTKFGPFWEDNRKHGPNDYMVYKEDIVTDSALGEAAFCCLNKIDQRLVSLAPSSWEFSTLSVVWKFDDTINENIEVKNYWKLNDVEKDLQNNPKNFATWNQLAEESKNRYQNLFFSDSCFHPLRGISFNESIAQRIFYLLDILEQLKNNYDANGNRTQKGHELFQKYFTGNKALFSDSSDYEKHYFKKVLRRLVWVRLGDAVPQAPWDLSL